MADQVQYPGRLIAIDGTRGKDLAAAAAALIAALQQQRVECAISRFDASGLFGELAGGRGDRNSSTRTLTLVFAADLAFRLRWEIRPVLEAGGVVIAAPYVDTAIAVGAGFGLDEDWIRDLLRFAPKPHFRAAAEEKKVDKGWKARLNRDYGEYSAAMLTTGPANTSPRLARQEAIALLQRPRGRKVHRLTESGIAALAKAIIGSLKGGPFPSVSPPRSGRK